MNPLPTLLIKRVYFANLKKKYTLSNKFFWKTIEPSLSEKVMTKGRTNLFEKGESAKIELETAEVLNKFFSNIISNLEISKYSNYESFNLSNILC